MLAIISKAVGSGGVLDRVVLSRPPSIADLAHPVESAFVSFDLLDLRPRTDDVGGPHVLMARGLDLDSVPGLQRFDGDSPIQTVAWTDQLIELSGIISGDTLTLSGSSS